MEEDEADLLVHLLVLEQIVIIPSSTPSLFPSLPPSIQSHCLEIERGFESELLPIPYACVDSHWHTFCSLAYIGSALLLPHSLSR
jgi:hypothetical protein